MRCMVAKMYREGRESDDWREVDRLLEGYRGAFFDDGVGIQLPQGLEGVTFSSKEASLSHSNPKLLTCLNELLQLHTLSLDSTSQSSA